MEHLGFVFCDVELSFEKKNIYIYIYTFFVHNFPIKNISGELLKCGMELELEF